MKMNKWSCLITVLAATPGLLGCVKDKPLIESPGRATLRFDFGMANTREIANNRNIPLPNDLYFLDANGVKQSKLVIMGCGSTDVGPEPDVENATKCALEDLDGWSTTAPFSLPLSGDISQLDTGSFVHGVHLIGDGQPLIMDQDFTVIATDFGHLQILPLKVLRPKTAYTLVITRDLTDLSGAPIAPSQAYVASKRESGAFGQQINRVEALAAATLGIGANTITYAAQFTTQSIGGELVNIKPADLAVRFDSARTETYKVDGFLPLTKPEEFTGELVEKLFATVELPNYLATSQAIAQNCKPDEKNRAEAEFWYTFYGANAHYDGFKFTKNSCPDLYKSINFHDTTTSTVEVSMVLPKRSASGSANYDVVIAAHGIASAKQMGNGGVPQLDFFTQPKMASRAKTRRADGYAIVAIDHYLHGTRSISFDNSAGFDCNGDGLADAGCFRDSDQAVPLNSDYDLSVTASLRGLAAGFGHADVKNFLQAEALLTSRDRLRKVVADLVNLKAAISQALDASGKVKLNAERISVFGHSMGGIVAASAAGIAQMRHKPFAGVVLANSGGGIGGIVMNSPWFGQNEVPPAIKFLPEYRLRMARELGIEQADEQTTLVAVRQFAENQPEVFRATSDQIAPQYLAEFQYLIQAVVDSVDPLNYAAELLAQPMLSISAVGNIDSHPELQDAKGAGFTAADQTVPFRIEPGPGTTFERCVPAPQAALSVTSQAGLACANGTEHVPYYSLNVTEFPLAGAESLDQALQLADVCDGTQRSATWLTAGNHLIGVSTVPDTVSEGSNSLIKVKQAASELLRQTIDFLTDDGKQFGVVGQPDEALLPGR